MKPPAFQFYADDFLAGTIGMTPSEVGCYIRLLCAQWNTGSIPADPETLKRLAGDIPTPYVLSKFRKAGSVLKNLRMERERKKQNAFRVKRSESGKKGAESRWQTHSGAIKLPMANDGSPSPSPISGCIGREREKGFPEIPPMPKKDFDAMADVQGIPRDCAEHFWNAFDATNWVDKHGNSVRNVAPLLRNYFTSWRANGQQRKVEQPNIEPPATSGAKTVQMNKEFDRVIARIEKIQNGAASDAMGSKFYTPKEKSELAALKERKAELKKELGIVV